MAITTGELLGAKSMEHTSAVPNREFEAEEQESLWNGDKPTP